MAEAQLRIKPTVIGSASGALRRDSQALAKLDRQQSRAIASGVAGTRKLERGWDAVTRAGHRSAAMVGTVSRNLFSMRTVIGGVIAGAAGKTVFDMVIGSNAKLEQQRITFETMIGDVGKAGKLMMSAAMMRLIGKCLALGDDRHARGQGYLGARRRRHRRRLPGLSTSFASTNATTSTSRIGPGASRSFTCSMDCTAAGSSHGRTCSKRRSSGARRSRSEPHPSLRSRRGRRGLPRSSGAKS